MRLPRIPATTPVVIERVEKTYPDLYVKGVAIRETSRGQFSLDALVVPYNYDTMDRDDTSVSRHRVADILGYAATNREVAQAIGVILAAVPDMIAYIAELKAKSEMDEPIKVPVIDVEVEG